MVHWQAAAVSLAALVAVALPSNGMAAPVDWDWTWTPADGLTDSGSGTLTTDPEAGGSYLITAMSGTFDGNVIISLISPGACCGLTTNTNLLYPGSPQLDAGGVAFSISGDQIAFYYQSAPFPGYYISDYVGAIYDGHSGTFAARLATKSTPVPEPVSLALLAPFVIGLGASATVADRLGLRPQPIRQPPAIRP